ncbi:uncharacterized protein LOC129581609 [Paramacrobiotus metropolitanus]|uniref:uncharacterized protein LOC129581609 n=1 Tax=Paramacrobiotus metropolitanus TaxID=2943436 RepID=UPI002445DEC6|nr:uncharacterized protein LOC129581609 [Paramacrobiotus metropolitanus]
MKVQRIHLIIPLLAILVVAVRGAVVRDQLTGLNAADRLTLCEKLGDSIPVTIKAERLSMCAHIISFRIRQFGREMARQLEILEGQESLDRPLESLPIATKPSTRKPDPWWWMEPWFIALGPTVRKLYRESPQSVRIITMVCVVCTYTAFQPVVDCFMEDMEQCVGIEKKIQLWVTWLAHIALFTLGLNVITQFTYVSVTLAEMYVENWKS